jgi:hypothetical protein
MMKSVRSLLKPWMFVVLGVGLTMASAVLTNAVIAEKNREMLLIEHNCIDIEKRIDQHWQQTKSLEYEEYTGTIILLFSDLAKSGNSKAKNEASELALKRYIEKILLSGRVPEEKTDHIRSLIKQPGGIPKALDEIFQLVDKNRIETVSTINDLYGEKQQLEQERARIRAQVAKFSAIALFLHVMGVILVLMKDFAKTTRTLTPKTYHAEPSL